MDKANSNSLSTYLPQDLVSELFDAQSKTSTTPSINSPRDQEAKAKNWKKASTALEKTTSNETIQLSSNAKTYIKSQTQLGPKSSRKIDTMNINHFKKYAVKEPVILTPSLFSMNVTIKEFFYNSGMKLPVIITSVNGSQFLLKRINEFTEEDVDMFIIFISKDLIGVMCDIYGHVFVQQMIVMKTNPNQRLEILKLIKPFFIQISSDQYGTKCIQTLIMLIQSQEEEKIIKNATKKYILDLSLNPHSSQVIHQLIIGLAEKKRNFLVKFISFNFFSFCKNANGILVLMKFITEVKESLAITSIITAIESNLLQFTCSQQLSLILFQAFDSFGYGQCIKLINAILSRILQLANNDCGVKVVDRVINMIQCSNSVEFSNLVSFIFLNEGNLVSLLNTLHGQKLLARMWSRVTESMKTEIKGRYVQTTPVYQALTSFEVDQSCSLVNSMEIR